ncbi:MULTISPECIES: RsfA family transcriptional regulator [Brevibacillus]|uniref:RsfA family transcriptional regulator n=1 Tax=Brevibacillus TaxID=55080 RepID=UPI00046952DD|nr:RsfA family transcriptional regulator [Brevibacillus borstelensis]KKX54378.1 precorrin-3B C17-methyltransferase [Brevibacillus borstelensis cifa_chp40]MBE5395917.1 RsfA family transcriptional regulator [Brevibacillus borstelensis]MCC0563263.1 RsfA family transcriptional regulator [Brevibacillus borstelensis]MCM3471264.1 RsfA family transcriptional regulator [Brevibacillus borstelensis]MCM3557685.1 RsfA family transcriptional regulator [Brevibacillus borstelensis]
MVASRQDAWTEDDDLVLAEVTLRHIREGGTQLAAFEEVGQRLGRTAAACGFRWNSCVRKRYDAAIVIAKNQRQQLKKMGRLTSVQTEVNGEAQLLRKQQSPVQQLSPSGSAEEQIEAVIRMLMNHKDLVRKVRQLEQELEGKVLEIKELKEAHDRMKKDLEQVQGVNEDYKALVQIMERARKMAFLNEEEPVKAIFKMDENGNLERVEK